MGETWEEWVTNNGASQIEIPLGVVVRRTPGVTRWVKWNWTAVAVLPGAGSADWSEMRREGDAIEYHAATLPLTLYSSDTEAYLANLTDAIPSVYLVMRDENGAGAPPEAVLVTVSPYEGQDYADNGEDIVEKIPMPAGLIAWVRDFALAHHQHEEFKKRRRDKKRIDLQQDGIGDARIRQDTDVYRAPAPRARRVVQ
ncbi:DUF3305 domain-containing protein [Seohaeicola saemankumensis]|nr:DUF3305 domain-containing protein [Seohaeicola saemankumensis]MCA0869843.1 DUF3305 domain-containing protein [Seohaeicola saemankumensis]